MGESVANRAREAHDEVAPSCLLRRPPGERGKYLQRMGPVEAAQARALAAVCFELDRRDTCRLQACRIGWDRQRNIGLGAAYENDNKYGRTR